MKQLLDTWEWKPVVRALMACKGFQEVAAMTVISELGDLRRFEHPRALMSFLGLVPGEDSSGPKHRQGSITKCGNSHCRWMLVECCPALPKSSEGRKPAHYPADRTKRRGERTLLEHAKPPSQTLRQTQSPWQK
jgi:transposase